MKPLEVDPDVTFDVSRAVTNEVVELHEELVGEAVDEGEQLFEFDSVPHQRGRSVSRDGIEVAE